MKISILKLFFFIYCLPSHKRICHLYSLVMITCVSFPAKARDKGKDYINGVDYMACLESGSIWLMCLADTHLDPESLSVSVKEPLIAALSVWA